MFPAAVFTAIAEDTPKPPSEPLPERLRIVSYNVYNFADSARPQIKSPESRQTVLDILARLDPDIMVLTETSGAPAIAEIQAELKTRGRDYPVTSVVEAFDQQRRIGILSRIAPAEIRHVTDASYNLKGRSVRVRRGFAHCIFQWGKEYRLHLLGAHLKSKVFDPLGQTDMRRYEARLLRYLFNDIREAEPEANVLLVGDLNDTPESSPVSTLCSRRSKPENEFYDLRPIDRYSLSWTHCWDIADTYSRIDYAMVSYGLLPEVDLDALEIPTFPEWDIASDHRPLVVTIKPGNKPVTEAHLALFERNFRIPARPQSSFHEGRVVGTRKARKQ